MLSILLLLFGMTNPRVTPATIKMHVTPTTPMTTTAATFFEGSIVFTLKSSTKMTSPRKKITKNSRTRFVCTDLSSKILTAEQAI